MTPGDMSHDPAFATAAAPDRGGPPTHQARTLTEGGETALIRLADQVYTLRITRQGKLILTK